MCRTARRSAASRCGPAPRRRRASGWAGAGRTTTCRTRWSRPRWGRGSGTHWPAARRVGTGRRTPGTATTAGCSSTGRRGSRTTATSTRRCRTRPGGTPRSPSRRGCATSAAATDRGRRAPASSGCRPDGPTLRPPAPRAADGNRRRHDRRVSDAPAWNAAAQDAEGGTGAYPGGTATGASPDGAPSPDAAVARALNVADAAGRAPSDGARLLGPAEVRALADELGLRPTKRLGQNFVHDANAVRRIVRAADLAPDDVVLEVGPG